MSQTVCLIFLLVTLLAVISTPANASPLEKKWDKKCCPVSQCVFNQGEFVDLKLPLSNYVFNTFNGILSFTESPKNKLQISGFIDIDGVTTNTIEDFPFWDLHVAPCNTAITATPGENPTTIDLDVQSFDKPIHTSVPDDGLNTAATYTINDIKDQCCFVVNEFGSEFILGIAKVVPVVLEDCSTPPTPTPYSSSSSYYSAPTPTPSGK